MILYFSGTGNTQWVAQQIALALSDEIIPMTFSESVYHLSLKDNERLGIVFPVHGWTMPKVVKEFLRNIIVEDSLDHYIYIVCTYGDDMGKTYEETCQLLHKKGISLHSCYSLQMPNSYVALPGFDTDSPAVVSQKVHSAKANLQNIIDKVERRVKGDRFDFPGQAAWLKTYVLGSFFHRFLMNPSRFKSDARCVGCGACSQQCPLHNISMNSSHPSWGNRCTMCLRCYHACPNHSISYTSFTRNKSQYLFSPRILNEKS